MEFLVHRYKKNNIYSNGMNGNVLFRKICEGTESRDDNDEAGISFMDYVE